MTAKVYVKMRGNGLQGRCTCKRVGRGVFSNLGALLKKTGRSLLNSGKKVLPSVIKQVAPTLLTVATANLSEKASRAGVPDSIINLGNQLAQRGARDLAKDPNKGLNKTETAVSSFLSDKSADILSKLISGDKGSGLRPLGRGNYLREARNSLSRQF